MFDFPEPLGPTTTDTPGANSSLVTLGKDLKPFTWLSSAGASVVG